MTVYEIIVSIYITKSIDVLKAQGAIVHFIDSYLIKDEEFSQYHKKREQKCYTFDLPIPIEKGMKEYKGGCVYKFRIRTADKELLEYLKSGIADHRTDNIKGLAKEVKVIPHKHISKLYTLTPMILTDPKGRGFWRDYLSFEEFEDMLRKSIIHQYEVFTGEKVDENCPLYDQIELKNKHAIGTHYKGIVLLGDKISMQIADNETAQKIAYFLLASGVGRRGSRGSGFLGYRFM